MTVAVTHRYTLSVVGGVKQLQRRRLPTRFRRQRPEASKVSNEAADTSSPLKTLRQSYTRRGLASLSEAPKSTPPTSEDDCSVATREVSQVSIAGAKRRYVELDVPSSEEDYSSDSSDSFLSSSSSTTREYRRYGSTKSSRHVKYVQFATHSVVVEIPHFLDYSSTQKAAMWNGSSMIKRMARKNTVEFQFDGWQMDTAAEEEDFVLVEGVPVHPAHATLSVGLESE